MENEPVGLGVFTTSPQILNWKSSISSYIKPRTEAEDTAFDHAFLTPTHCFKPSLWHFSHIFKYRADVSLVYNALKQMNVRRQTANKHGLCLLTIPFTDPRCYEKY